MTARKVKILLADDHPLIRSGISHLLQSYADFLIVGEAGDGEEAIAKIKELSPDVVIMDISMPKLNGIEAIKIIRKKFSSTRILVLSMYDDEEYI
jgi:DNA-binding NarL/FixJ family response regulator